MRSLSGILPDIWSHCDHEDGSSEIRGTANVSYPLITEEGGAGKEQGTIFHNLYDLGSCLQARSITFINCQPMHLPKQLLAQKAYKSLFIERPTALLVFDIGKPWLGTARAPQKILLVDGVLISLVQNRTVSLVILAS